jgi:hypothetical protein
MSTLTGLRPVLARIPAPNPLLIAPMPPPSAPPVATTLSLVDATVDSSNNEAGDSVSVSNNLKKPVWHEVDTKKAQKPKHRSHSRW